MTTLPDLWERRAQRLLADATATDEPRVVPEKRAMEHAAIIYANCAMELRRENEAKSLLGLILQHFKDKR